MKNFLPGKIVWGYVIGAKAKHSVPLVENFYLLVDTRENNNSKVITWINNSVTRSIGMQLAKYDTSKEVWNYLERLYT